MTSEILKTISIKWQNDSLSCKGYRKSVADMILKSKIDSINKSFLISTLGKPNQIQKIYSGNTKKNYMAYIYFIYKDQCPKIGVEGRAIQFIFEEDKEYASEISAIEYCG